MRYFYCNCFLPDFHFFLLKYDILYLKLENLTLKLMLRYIIWNFFFLHFYSRLIFILLILTSFDFLIFSSKTNIVFHHWTLILLSSFMLDKLTNYISVFLKKNILKGKISMKWYISLVMFWFNTYKIKFREFDRLSA